MKALVCILQSLHDPHLLKHVVLEVEYPWSLAIAGMHSGLDISKFHSQLVKLQSPRQCLVLQCRPLSRSDELLICWHLWQQGLQSCTSIWALSRSFYELVGGSELGLESVGAN